MMKNILPLMFIMTSLMPATESVSCGTVPLYYLATPSIILFSRAYIHGLLDFHNAANRIEHPVTGEDILKEAAMKAQARFINTVRPLLESVKDAATWDEVVTGIPGIKVLLESSRFALGNVLEERALSAERGEEPPCELVTRSAMLDAEAFSRTLFVERLPLTQPIMESLAELYLDAEENTPAFRDALITAMNNKDGGLYVLAARTIRCAIDHGAKEKRHMLWYVLSILNVFFLHDDVLFPPSYLLMKNKVIQALLVKGGVTIAAIENLLDGDEEMIGEQLQEMTYRFVTITQRLATDIPFRSEFIADQMRVDALDIMDEELKQTAAANSPYRAVRQWHRGHAASGAGAGAASPAT